MTENGDVATIWDRRGAIRVARKPLGEAWSRSKTLANARPWRMLSTAGTDGWTFYWEEEASESHAAHIMTRSLGVNGDLGPLIKVADTEPAYDGDIWVEASPAGASVIAGLYERGESHRMVIRVSTDGETWARLPPAAARHHLSGRRSRILGR